MAGRKPSMKLSANWDIERKWKEWQLGRRDFMSHQQDKWRTASVKGKCKQVKKEVRRLMRAAGMEKQGNCMVELGGFMAGEGKMDIWKMEPYELQFQLKYVYDVLPSPSRASIK